MRSIAAYTEEIDDLELAVEELFSQIDGFDLASESLGIIYIDVEVDYSELYRLLRVRYDFPIIGSTALAMFTDSHNVNNTGIAMLILTADDCSFSVGMTQSLNLDNYVEEIRHTYGEIAKPLDNKEKLVIHYSTMGIIGDYILSAIQSSNKEVSIFGGNASDVYTFNEFRVFCNEKESSNSTVLALVSGNIDPRFFVIGSVAGKANVSYKVTEVNDNKVYKIGNDPFIKGLEKIGMGTDKTDLDMDFVMSPFIMTLEPTEGDRIKVARVLSEIDQEKGAGIFTGAVSKGSSLEIGIMNVDNLRDSLEEALDGLFDSILQSGKGYNTILCISCASRHMTLIGNADLEAKALLERTREGCTVTGMYSYGEYCPVTSAKKNRYNIYHNYTFTLLLL